MKLLDPVAALARTILPDSALRTLRGEFTSVRHRFIGHPRELLRLWWFKQRGGTYMEWHARRQDKFTERVNRGYTNEEWSKLSAYMATGGEDLEWLKSMGVAPSDRVHEFGMGYGRTAQHFIRYLDPGRFSGNDASGGRIHEGMAYLEKETDCQRKDAKFIVNEDNSFEWMNGEQVDFIWCHAVLAHMPEEDIKDFFKNARKVMNENTRLFFTYSDREEATPSFQSSVKDWHHRFDFFADICGPLGFELEKISVPKHKNYNVVTRAAIARLTGAAG